MWSKGKFINSLICFNVILKTVAGEAMNFTFSFFNLGPRKLVEFVMFALKIMLFLETGSHVSSWLPHSWGKSSWHWKQIFPWVQQRVRESHKQMTGKRAALKWGRPTVKDTVKTVMHAVFWNTLSPPGEATIKAVLRTLKVSSENNPSWV